jgi:hypothetical protein
MKAAAIPSCGTHLLASAALPSGKREIEEYFARTFQNNSLLLDSIYSICLPH